MPEPFNKWSSDYPIYRYVLNPLARKICFVHPNIVTLACGLTTIPIVLNIINNGSSAALVFWFVLKALLDCLDGSIARSCNKSSKLGAFLDIFDDSFSSILITCSVIYVILKRRLFTPIHIGLGIVCALWIGREKIMSFLSYTFNLTYS